MIGHIKMIIKIINLISITLKINMIKEIIIKIIFQHKELGDWIRKNIKHIKCHKNIKLKACFDIMKEEWMIVKIENILNKSFNKRDKWIHQLIDTLQDQIKIIITEDSLTFLPMKDLFSLDIQLDNKIIRDLALHQNKKEYLAQ